MPLLISNSETVKLLHKVGKNLIFLLSCTFYSRIWSPYWIVIFITSAILLHISGDDKTQHITIMNLGPYSTIFLYETICQYWLYWAVIHVLKDFQDRPNDSFDINNTDLGQRTSKDNKFTSLFTLPKSRCSQRSTSGLFSGTMHKYCRRIVKILSPQNVRFIRASLQFPDSCEREFCAVGRRAIVFISLASEWQVVVMFFAIFTDKERKKF